MNRKIGIIGAGNMGGAIIKGLLAGTCRTSDLVIADTREDILQRFAEEFPGINTTTDNRRAASGDILILAVKPQVYQTVAEGIVSDLSDDVIVVSIAAGITLKQMTAWMGASRKLVRTMPNTPALVGEGMTGICPGANVGSEDLQAVREVFDAVGRTVIMPEHLMDAYTSVAGSSPAWVFMFLEALADGAVNEGIPRAQAYEIAAQAVIGSAKLALETGVHPGELKDRVCSPAGTTIAAVADLEKNGFRSAIIQAVRVCTRRSRELGS